MWHAGGMPGYADPYAVLGVAPTATAAEVRAAYRRRIALDHADRHGGDAAAAERTRELNLARDTLLDPLRRAALDRARLTAPASDPLLDQLGRHFGAAPPPSSAVRAPPAAPGWLHAVAVGFVGAATVVSIAAAAVRAARLRGR